MSSAKTSKKGLKKLLNEVHCYEPQIGDLVMSETGVIGIIFDMCDDSVAFKDAAWVYWLQSASKSAWPTSYIRDFRTHMLKAELKLYER